MSKTNDSGYKDLYLHLLSILGVNDHEAAAAEIGRLHGALIARVAPPLTQPQLYNLGFNMSAEFGPDFAKANEKFAMAVIEAYRGIVVTNQVQEEKLVGMYAGPKEGILLEPDAVKAIAEWSGYTEYHESSPEDICGMTLWVGHCQDDDGRPVYGLHAFNVECPEEGSITLTELPESPVKGQARIGSKWRHRNGGIYTEIARGLLEADLTPVVIYQGEDGRIWVRSESEFLDGRFTGVERQPLKQEQPS